MGLFIRKSKNIGPVRINLSKSGLGVSTGIKGARISTSPRGTYLHAGRNGLYYRKKIGGSSQKATRKDSPAKLERNNKLPARVILLLVLASFLLLFALIVLA